MRDHRDPSSALPVDPERARGDGRTNFTAWSGLEVRGHRFTYTRQRRSGQAEEHQFFFGTRLRLTAPQLQRSTSLSPLMGETQRNSPQSVLGHCII